MDVEIAGVVPGAFERWLAEQAPQVAQPLTTSLLTGGRSNLTYRLDAADGARYALRRPPVSSVLQTAHDMAREWRFLRALAGTAVPVAEPVAWCDDRSVADADFYVMGFVEGRILDAPGSADHLDRAARRRVGEQLVEVLAALHRLDAVGLGLGTEERARGYVARQLRRWSAQVSAVEPPELDTLLRGAELLAARAPEQRTGIVHGDYRLGNVAVDDEGTVRAVFDWELATVGDVHADLGWLLATWSEPGDNVLPSITGPTADGGFATRAELAARYQELAGVEVPDLPFYVAFAHWRLCCISVGVRHRYLSGAMADDGFDARALDDQIGWWAQHVVDTMAEPR
ncbi:phosphotransferase family protein [Nocardioides caldifontis]|uniref:phosphotransferase family protein n=1 Tax=Nocardioides caldifontis TaxID=2588938 RepID=UPI0011E04ECB|nr:phosphotransferase family protein [Nocardioides caldifontis]